MPWEVRVELTHVGARALLEQRQDLQPDPPRITNVPQEVGVLPDTLDAEGLTVGADGDDQLVVRDVGDGALGQLGALDEDVGALGALGGRGGRQHLLGGQVVDVVLLDADGLLVEVHVVGPALVELDVSQPPHRLERGAELEGADGG